MNDHETDRNDPRDRDEKDRATGDSAQNDAAEPALDFGRIRREAGPAFVLAILWSILPLIGSIALLTNLGAAADFLNARGSLGLVWYAAAFAITSGLGLLPTHAQAALGGWVFGMQRGLIGALAGLTLGAIIGFVVSRTLSRDRVRTILDRFPEARIVRAALLDRGWWRSLGILTLLRVPPNMPFAISNLAMASAGARFVPYSIAALVGMSPRTAVTVYFAAAASATGARDIQEFTKAGDGKWLLAAGIVVLVGVLWLIGKIGNAALARALPPANRPR